MKIDPEGVEMTIRSYNGPCTKCDKILEKTKNDTCDKCLASKIDEKARMMLQMVQAAFAGW